MEVRRTSILDLLAIMVIGFWAYATLFHIKNVDYDALSLFAFISVLFLLTTND